MKKFLTIICIMLCAFIIFTACETVKNNDDQDNANNDNVIDSDDSNNDMPDESVTDDNNQQETGSSLSADHLKAILDDAKLEIFAGLSEEIKPEMINSMTGLTTEQYLQYCKGNFYSTGMSAVAHLVVMIECNDADSALAVKDIVAANFDTGRWVCVFPDQSFVVESGNFVFLVSTKSQFIEPLTNAFSAHFDGQIGEINVFQNNIA